MVHIFQKSKHTFMDITKVINDEVHNLYTEMDENKQPRYYFKQGKNTPIELTKEEALKKEKYLEGYKESSDNLSKG